MSKNKLGQIFFGSACWTLAIALMLIVTYPTSPMLYIFFSLFPKFIYLAVVIFICILCMLLNYGLKIRNINIIDFRLYGLLSIILFFCSYIFTKNETAIRDLLSILVICFFLLQLPRYLYINVIRKYILINAALLFGALVLLLAMYLNIYDYSEWHVLNLSLLKESNPVVLREHGGDFSYYMPFFYILIPYAEQGINIFGFEYLRQPLIYTESAYTWLYTLGLFFYTIADDKIKFRRFSLIVFGCSLGVSISVQGSLSILAAFIVIIAFRRSIYLMRHPKVFLLLVILFSGSLIYLGVHEYLLGFFLPDKFTQYEYYYEAISLLDRVKGATILGDNNQIQHDYGSFTIIQRYGILGYGLYIFLSLWLFVSALRLLNHHAENRKNYFLCLAILTTIFISFRVPQFNLLLPLILMASSLRVDHNNSGTHIN